MRKVKAALLVFDYDLYPRNNLDEANVRALVDAMTAGDELPPVVIDKATKKIIDGFHRVKAALRLDPEAEVAVVEKRYPNEAAMFLDAVRYNSTHGVRLDPCDRARCTILAERLSIPLEDLAGALHVPAQKLGRLRADRTARGSGGLSVPIKRTISHMRGKRLTKRQEAANAKLGGMTAAFYANQLILLIESDLLNREDTALLERLRRLHELLESVLAVA